MLTLFILRLRGIVPRWRLRRIAARLARLEARLDELKSL